MSYHRINISKIGPVVRGAAGEDHIISGLEYEIYEEQTNKIVRKVSHPGKLKFTNFEMGLVTNIQKAEELELAAILLRGMFRLGSWKTKYVRETATELWDQLFISRIRNYSKMDRASAGRAAVKLLQLALGVDSFEFASYAYKSLKVLTEGESGDCLENDWVARELTEIFQIHAHEPLPRSTIPVRFAVLSDFSKAGYQMTKVVNVFNVNRGTKKIANAMVLVQLLKDIIQRKDEKLLQKFCHCANSNQLIYAVKWCAIDVVEAESEHADVIFGLFKKCSKKMLKQHAVAFNLVTENKDVSVVKRYLTEVNPDVRKAAANHGQPLSQALNNAQLEMTKLLICYGGNVSTALNDNRRWKTVSNDAIEYAASVEPLYVLLSKRKSRPLSHYAKYYKNKACVKTAAMNAGIGAVERALKNTAHTTCSSLAERL